MEWQQQGGEGQEGERGREGDILVIYYNTCTLNVLKKVELVLRKTYMHSLTVRLADSQPGDAGLCYVSKFFPLFRAHPCSLIIHGGRMGHGWVGGAYQS